MIKFSILAPAMLLGGLLLAAAWTDWRSRTIPNGLNAAIALLAPLWWWALGLSPWPEIAWQVGLALLAFAVFAGAFAAGMMGGGDVKMIGALALWLAPFTLVRMLMIMALAGGVLTIAMVVAHKAMKRRGQPEIPYGLAISAAGIFVITNQILTSIGH
jgi:prepilin peptidase CpaA